MMSYSSLELEALAIGLQMVLQTDIGCQLSGVDDLLWPPSFPPHAFDGVDDEMRRKVQGEFGRASEGNGSDRKSD